MPAIKRLHQLIKKTVRYLFTKKITIVKWELDLLTVIVLGLGISIGTYLTLIKFWPTSLALNDTNKLWTFNSAGASGFTYDTSLITVDDTGAHPVSGVNKLSNPAFALNNTSWSVAAVPPSGWVEVPGNGTYSTTNFLAMKYEAKIQGMDSGSQTYNSSYVAESRATGTPWVNISQTNAIAECAALGSSYHLISNNEWMTMARDAEAQSTNWNGGVVGTSYMFSGHNDNSPANSIVASSDDTLGYTNTGQSSPSNQKRTLTLSNGAVLWDIPGNVWEWTNNIQSSAIDTTAGWVEWNHANIASGARDLYGPSSASYLSANGMGQVYGGALNNGFLRGGSWDGGARAGAFTLILSDAPSSTYPHVGFRCASDPVAISQSFSSTAGRAGADGNSVVIGTVSDGKIYQSVNVGDTSTYDLSAYVYNNTAGAVGGTVDTTVAQLYYGGNTISSAAWTEVTGETGWYKLTGTVTGVASGTDTGVLVKAGKTVIVDDVTLSKQGTYSVYTTSAYSNAQVNSWDTFCEGTLSGSTCTTDATHTGNAAITYQICLDDGSSCFYTTGSRWQYYTSGAWANATDATSTYTNTPAQLTQAAMQALSITSQKISVKAILAFGGADTPLMPNISIGLTTDTTVPVTNASVILMSRSNGGNSVASNGWTNNLAPYFSWTAGADNIGGADLKGYCLYLGTDTNASYTATSLLGTTQTSVAGTNCTFITNQTSINFSTTSYRGSTWLTTSSSPYYLKIWAIDNSGNIFPTAASFQFKFDNTEPSNPSGLTAPSTFQRSLDSFTVAWATTGSTAAADSHSGVLGYQYRLGSSGTWYGSNRSGAQDCTDLITGGSYTLNSTYDSLSTGNNTFYLRTYDTACNVTTSNVTAILKYNAVTPSVPTSLTVTPTTNTTNSYAFSWSPPTSYSGSSTGLTYCYTINTAPSLASCTFTSAGATSLTADAFATQPSTNTLYLLAKDEAGNVNYSDYASVDFIYTGSAPGVPKGVDVADVSIKASSNWKLAVSWEKPTDSGSGVKTYKVYRSTTSTSCSANFSKFTNIGSTAGTTYSDTSLTQQNYYYCVKACDSANNCSAVSSTVSKYPTGKYYAPATLLSGPAVSNVTTKRARITWVTDRSSDSRVAYGLKSGEYNTVEASTSTQETSHTIDLTNLNPGTIYYYKAKWTDEDGNTGASDEKSFTTEAKPVVKEPIVKNIALSSAVVQFTSIGASKVRIYYGTSTNFGGVKEVSTNAQESTYTPILTSLDDGTKYYYKLNPVDSEGAEYDEGVNSFETLPRPRISGVRLQQVKGTAQSAVLVTWTTNTEVSSIATYYPEDNPLLVKDEVNLDLVEGEHKLILRTLSPTTTYNLVVKGRDKVGNEAISDIQRFTTATDTRPPVINEVRIEGTNVPPVGGAAQEVYSQLIISWNTDEPSTSQVEYGEGTGETYVSKTQLDTNLTYNHLVIISGLSPSKVYHLRTISSDKASNIANSFDTVTITPKATDNALDLVIATLQEVFGFLKR